MCPARTVVFISPSSRLLGARRSLLQLVANLDPERYRPVVVTNAKGDLVDALRDAGIGHHLMQMLAWRKFRYFLHRPFQIRALAKIFRVENAALIHCNEFHSTPYAVRAARRAGKNGADLPVISHMRLSITPRQIHNYDLDKAARVVCVSHSAARDFHLWPDWKQRVSVIYNGVDLEDFHPSGTREEIRARLGLPDVFTIGQFGLVSPRKRPHLLIEAAARLRDSGGNFQVLLVGSPGRSDQEYHASLLRMVEEKRLEDRVRFVPFTPEVVPYYQACDVNILNSNDEGFGRTIIEAGALGVPSIGARVGGIPELIADGETGLLIPEKEEPAPLAEALGKLMRETSRVREMGASARRHVEGHFSIRRHVDAIMALYDGILQSPMI